MRQIVVGFLVFLLGLLAPVWLERAMNAAPDLAWRVAAFTSVVVGISIAVLSDPLYSRMRGPSFNAWVSTATIAVAFALVAGSAWWMFVVAGRVQTQADVVVTPQTDTFPAVEFRVTPERVATLINRGRFDVEEIRIDATEYQLAIKAVIPPVAEKLADGRWKIDPGRHELAIYRYNKFGRPSFQLPQLSFRNATPTIQDLKALPQFRFEADRPAVDNRPPQESPDFRFYALRLSFLDTVSYTRFVVYKVISCWPNPALPFDNDGLGIMGYGSQLDSTGLAEMHLKILPLILDHQRLLFAGSGEREIAQ